MILTICTFFLLKPGDNVIVMKTVSNEKYTCVLPENPDSRDEVCKNIYFILKYSTYVHVACIRIHVKPG